MHALTVATQFLDCMTEMQVVVLQFSKTLSNITIYVRRCAGRKSKKDHFLSSRYIVFFWIFFVLKNDFKEQPCGF